MPMWRCPHCGTPQQEAARCWVCHRSSTICSTCRHFRRSLAASVGYCGLDPRRAALTGAEHRGCWASAGEPAVAVAPPPEAPSIVPNEVLRLRPAERLPFLSGFVPVELAPHGQVAARATPAVPMADSRAIDQEVGASPLPDAGPSWANRDSLFGD